MTQPSTRAQAASAVNRHNGIRDPAVRRAETERRIRHVAAWLRTLGPRRADGGPRP
jgi:hypothetical protein